MMKIKELIVLADTLDEKGFHTEANRLDKLIRLAWFPMTKEDLLEKETNVKIRLRERGLSEEEIEFRLDLLLPERIEILSNLKVKANEENGQTILEDIMQTNQDPRVIDDPNGGHMCSVCGTHIPESEIQLGCRKCEEAMNLGFIRDPNGGLNPPRLKTPPRMYDRYRQEPPARIDVVDIDSEKSESPYSDTAY